jgi:hypothetical protein
MIQTGCSERIVNLWGKVVEKPYLIHLVRFYNHMVIKIFFNKFSALTTLIISINNDCCERQGS